MVLLRTVNIFRNYFRTNVQRSVRYSLIAPESTAYLTNSGVSKYAIDGNPFLLDLKLDTLHCKMAILKQMRPRHIDDFVPLLKIEETILRDVARKAAEEYDMVPEQHRIYYFSKELQIVPSTVSKFCARYEKIFFTEFAGVEKKLKILLDYNVDGMQILQSLYVFECANNVLFSRLDQLSKVSYDYKPWYFKLTDAEFRKYGVENGKAQATELSHKLRHSNLEKSAILTEINGMLSCDDEISTRIYYDFLHRFDQLPPAERIFQLLTNNGVGLQCIQSNPVVLTLPYAQIDDNIKLIKEMRPLSIDDFLPLVAIKTTKLRTFASEVNKREIELHPIYLFSKKLNITPAIVSKHFAEHSKLFYYRDFVGFVTKLDILVAYTVDPMSILRAPNTFGASAVTIENRLKRCKAHGIETVLSWMLCDRNRTEISVAKRVDEKTVLGECADTVDYIAKRLNWDAAAKRKALKTYPPLVKCSVTKVKNHLDYLLNETHFTIDDINSTMAVFRTKLDELKLRMGELAAIGLVPRKLYSICLDKRSYLDMVWRFCERKNRPAAFELYKSIEKRVKKLQDD
ncbi:transcription termination factor, mitochondrial-like isoform X2 [Bradysia coprophila]|uniref:transcription termination factor, mitochondrial-like isoform X2 n=1 Tax=Bradysia coprophila TaxID=38358 RepID=UPI00187D7680|nr:transcription termination factor, mitochondrial-like isoform X2 [Bradysia coprophila]